MALNRHSFWGRSRIPAKVENSRIGLDRKKLSLVKQDWRQLISLVDPLSGLQRGTTSPKRIEKGFTSYVLHLAKFLHLCPNLAAGVGQLVLPLEREGEHQVDVHFPVPHMQRQSMSGAALPDSKLKKNREVVQERMKCRRDEQAIMLNLGGVKNAASAVFRSETHLHRVATKQEWHERKKCPTR